MEFSGDGAPQPLPAAEAETGISPEAEPELIQQSGHYPLRGELSLPIDISDCAQGKLIWRG